MELRYTLLGDGPTDAALLPILTFLLRLNCRPLSVQPTFADLRQLSEPPKGLSERVRATLYLNETDLLFVHRDAEKEQWMGRKHEIDNALTEAAKYIILPPVVRVIPVRMTEAWLFSSEAAIRKAAGNPNGKMPLEIPKSNRIEHLPDPKETLYGLLKTASGLKGRRLAKFSTGNLSRRVAELTEDFSPLRGIPSFDALEAEIKVVVETQNWHVAP